MKNNIKLSILIPCYNWDIYDFIHNLYKQCLREYKPNLFEIICLEDASINCYQNAKIAEIKEIKYQKLTHNIGRSAIRNLLAKKANSNWLLFIDCDSKLVNDNFIKNYKKKTEENKTNRIYYGHTLYEKNIDSDKMLHYKYGKKIESVQKKIHFSSHHFLIKKDTFNDVKFDTQLKNYGYEDVLFQIQSNYKFEYINNPLYHVGLKKTKIFLSDCEQGLHNLCKYTNNPQVTKKIKILRWFKNLTIAHRFIALLFKHSKKYIIINLKSKTPSLLLFQFYKLALLIQLKYDFLKKRK